MATEFDTQEEFSIEDFSVENLENLRPMTMDEVNRAAISLMAESDPVGSFQQISKERAIDNTSVTQKEVIQGNVDGTKEKLLEDTHKILASESLTNDQKKEQLQSISAGTGSLFETRNTAAAKLSSTPSLNEPLRKEEQVIEWSKNIAAWNDFVDFKQKALASFVAQTDAGKSTFKDFVDFASFVVPFIDPALRESVAKELSEKGLIEESEISNWMSPKTNQEAIISSMSVEDLAKRKAIVQEVLNAIDVSHKGFLNYDNDYAKVQLARDALEGGYWGDTEGFLGDTTLVLDFLALLLPTLNGYRVGGKLKDANEVTKVLDEVRGDYIKNGASPNSAAEMARNTNVDQAKKLHAALEAGDEDFAKAAYGTNKSDAMAEDILPDPHSPSGAIKQKITNVESIVDEVENIQRQSGRTVFTEAEKQQARLKVINEVERPSNELVSFRVNQSQFGQLDDAGRFRMSAVYGATDEAGFVSPQEGIEKVLFANKERGISQENLTVLKRNEEGRYVETSLDDATGNDYLIKMDTVHEVGVKEIRSIMTEDADLVRSSVLDMIPGFQGKATSYVKVMESTFDSKLTIPVLAEAERGTLIRDVMARRITSFVDQFKKLDNGMQVRVDNYLRKANLEGIKFSQKELAEQGFTKAEVDTIATFRQYYDDMWVLDNKLSIKGFTDDGFGIIEGIGEDTRFIAKPVSQIEAGATGRVYIDKTGEVMPLAQASRLGDEFSNLQLYRLPAEARTSTQTFEYVLANPDTWRGMRGSDIVKPYRDGYYTVSYTDPLFVRKRYIDADGRERTKAVATAGDIGSAKREVDRLNASNKEDGVEYFYSEDVREVRTAQRQVDMEHGNYDMKVRGERLLTSGDVSDEVLRAPIKDPLSAMITSADKLSKRIAMDETYRGMKARFLAAYEDVLPRGQYPNSVDEIATADPAKHRMVDQAKVMFNWMEAIQRPDKVSVDESFKKFMSRLANYMGRKGWDKTEKATRASSQIAPVGFIKKTVFDVFVALNPPRQLTLAVADSLKTAAIAPKYLASGQIFRDSTAMKMVSKGVPLSKAAKFAGRPESELKTLIKEFKSSGLSSGIQQQARVQKGIGTGTEELPLQEAAKGKGTLSKIKGVSEEIGFQNAERLQNLASWLAFREAKRTSAKRFNLTRTELDEVTGKARSFAYSQTKEASPAYNTSAAATVMQFAGVIHKGISMTLPEALGGSRLLSGTEKAKLWTFLLSTYGLSLTKGIDEELIKIENQEVRETLRGGLLWLLINKTTGASISTKNLNPADYAGFAERLYSIANADWSRATPALGLIDKFKYNAQIASGLWGDVGSDAFEMDTVEKMKVQAQALAEFFPAASNYMKGQVYQEMKRSVSKHNYTKDAELTSAEIFFKSFGFQTKEEEDRFLIRSMRQATLKEKQEDVKSLIEGIRAVASVKGISNEEVAKRLALSKVFWMAYKKDPDVVDMVDRELKFLLTNDDTVYQTISSMVGIMDPSEMKGIINIAPLTDEERAQANQLVDDVVNLKGAIE